MSRLPRQDDLAALRAQVVALAARVGVLENAWHLRESDHDWLAVLVMTYGNTRAFYVRQVIADADRSPYLRAAVSGMSALMIAARLRRLVKHPVPAFVVTMHGRDEWGCRWAIQHDEACGDPRPCVYCDPC